MKRFSFVYTIASLFLLAAVAAGEALGLNGSAEAGLLLANGAAGADMKQLKSAIDAGISKLEEKYVALETQVKEAGSASEELKSEIAAETEELKSNLETLSKQQDALENKLSRTRKGALVGAEGWNADFKSRLEEADGFKALQKGHAKAFKMDVLPVEQKATMTQGASLTGEVVAPQRVEGVSRTPDRPTHVRQFIASGQTNSNSIRYIEETGFTNSAAPVAEGALKPESDITMEAKDAPVRLIAHLARVSKQMLDDIPYLASYLGNRLRYGIRIEEDQQVLYGDGVGENLQGLTTYAASAYDKARLHGGEVSAIQRIDVLRFAILQARLAEYAVDTAMLNPVDLAIIDSLKDSQGRYLDQLDRLGVMVVENTAVVEDDFIVGAFSSGGVVQLFDRMQTTVEFFEQDRDNVPKNLVTVRVEERLALPVYRPEGIAYGTFADALQAPA